MDESNKMAAYHGWAISHLQAFWQKADEQDLTYYELGQAHGSFWIAYLAGFACSEEVQVPGEESWAELTEYWYQARTELHEETGDDEPAILDEEGNEQSQEDFVATMKLLLADGIEFAEQVEVDLRKMLTFISEMYDVDLDEMGLARGEKDPLEDGLCCALREVMAFDAGLQATIEQ